MSGAEAWFYIQDGKRQGPVGLDELVDRILTGKASPKGMVWHEGLADWSQAESLPQIAARLPPPIPTPPPLPNPAQTSASRHLAAGGSVACPSCGLVNPSEALRCDCGHDFASAQVSAGLPQPSLKEPAWYKATWDTPNRLATAGLWMAFVSIFCGSTIGLIPILSVIFSAIGLSRAAAFGGWGKTRASIGLVVGILGTLAYLQHYGYLR